MKLKSRIYRVYVQGLGFRVLGVLHVQWRINMEKIMGNFMEADVICIHIYIYIPGYQSCGHFRV